MLRLSLLNLLLLAVVACAACVMQQDAREVRLYAEPALESTPEEAGEPTGIDAAMAEEATPAPAGDDAPEAGAAGGVPVAEEAMRPPQLAEEQLEALQALTVADVAKLSREAAAAWVERLGAGLTPAWLVYAMEQRLPQLAALLVAAGADPNALDPQYPPLLVMVAYAGNIELAEYLVAQGADLKLEIEPGKPLDLLHQAAAGGQLEMLRWLTAHGVDDVEQLGTGGSTPLAAACSTGQLEIVRWLHEQGASLTPRTPDDKPMGLLPLAAYSGNNELSRWLMGQGLDVNQPDPAGRTALHYACLRGDVELVELLVEAGGRVDVVDDTGTTLLHTLVFSGSVELVPWLVERGADIDAVDEQFGVSALGLSLYVYNPRITEELLAQGASVDLITPEGETYLHLAAQQEHAELTEMMLAAGAEVNAAGPEGMTPLHYAVRAVAKSPVPLLLEAGADPLAADDNGQTPRDHAEYMLEYESSNWQDFKFADMEEIITLLRAAEGLPPEEGSADEAA